MGRNLAVCRVYYRGGVDVIKKCEYCGKEFEIVGDTPNHRRTKYCSVKCRTTVTNQKKAKPRQYHNLICVTCDRPFLSNRRDRVCCSPECSAKHTKYLNRERFRRKYWDEGKRAEYAKKEAPKRKVVTPAHEIEAEARKRGMNYGMYMALLQMEKERESRKK